MIAYPEGLPMPQREGYGFDPVSPTTSTKLVTGRTIRRRAFVSTPTVATVSWMFSPAEAQLFEGWFEHVLLSGTLTFECPLLTPLGLENHRAQFVDIYKGPDLIGMDFWKISAQVILFKRPMIDKEWVTDAPEYILGSDIFDITMNRVWTQPRND